MHYKMLSVGMSKNVKVKLTELFTNKPQISKKLENKRPSLTKIILKKKNLPYQILRMTLKL